MRYILQLTKQQLEAEKYRRTRHKVQQHPSFCGVGRHHPTLRHHAVKQIRYRHVFRYVRVVAGVCTPRPSAKKHTPHTQTTARRLFHTDTTHTQHGSTTPAPHQQHNTPAPQQQQYSCCAAGVAAPSDSVLTVVQQLAVVLLI